MDPKTIEAQRKLAQQFTHSSPPLPLLGDDEAPFLLRAIDDALTHQHRGNNLLLPDLKGLGNIAVFSDYAGNHKRYRSYSFLFTGYGAAQMFVDEMMEMRREHRLEDSEFQYKKKGNRAAKLAEQFADKFMRLPGLVVTFLVDKEIPSLFVERAHFAKETWTDAGLGIERPHVIERILTVAYTVAYFSCLLRRDATGLFWQTDRDMILETDEREQAVKRLLAGAIEFCSGLDDFPFETFGIAEPFAADTERNIAFRDLLAIPDLAAGVLSEVFERAADGAPVKKRKTQTRFDTSRNPYGHVVRAFCGQRVCLRNLTVVFSPSSTTDVPQLEIVTLGDSDVSPTMIYVD